MARPALDEKVEKVSFNAAADLSASLYCFVDVDSAGRAALASAGGRVIGVNYGKPDAIDIPGPVAISGLAKVKLGGTVAAGDNVTPDSTGRAVTQSAANAVSAGVCLTGGAVNEYGIVLLSGVGLASLASSIQTLSDDGGVVSLLTKSTLLAATGTDNHTLAAGLYEGQHKWLYMTVDASTGNAIITGTFIEGATAGTTLTFAEVGDSVLLEYHATGGWRVLLNVGAVAIA